MTKTFDKPKLFGVPRSGGTLVYNVVNYLYDNEISAQSHGYFKTDAKTIVVYRDFRDSCASKWRAMEGGFDEMDELKKMTKADVKRCTRGFNKLVKHLDKFKNEADNNPNREILFLRYEDFFDSQIGDVDFEYLLKQLSDFLDIKISAKQTKEIIKEFSFDGQKKESKKYSNFHEGWEEGSEGWKRIKEEGLLEEMQNRLIHGHHLFTGKKESWKLLVPDDCHDLLTERLSGALARWGYIDPSEHKQSWVDRIRTSLGI